ncbi:MAG TPA: hypothetical protein VGA87_01820, partial [Pyrinomonadaceae bacterium]
WLLVAVTFIFMFVGFLLGRIMAEYGVLFCDGCSLRWANLPWVIIAVLILVILSLLLKKFVTMLKTKLRVFVKAMLKEEAQETKENETVLKE